MTPAGSITNPFRIFNFDGLAVRVEAANAAHLEWLEEFLSPHFAVLRDGAFDVLIVLDESKARYDELHALGPLGPTVDCFALDSDVIRLPTWATVPPDTVIHDTQFKLFYVMSPDRTQVEIVAEPRNPLLRTPLMRVVREYAMAHSMSARNGVFLHASAIVAGEAGIVIAGAKSSGKTTLLTHLLRRPGARYLANDRVLASNNGSAVTLRGMPAILTFRPDMLERFPLLREQFLGGFYSHRRTLKEMSARRSPTKPWDDGRYGLTPRQYCHLLGTTPVASASLAALIFPTVTHQDGGIELQPLSEREGRRRLRASLLGTYDWEKSDGLFRLPGHHERLNRATLELRCDAILAHTSCYACHLGLQAYDDPSSADRLISALIHQKAQPT